MDQEKFKNYVVEMSKMYENFIPKIMDDSLMNNENIKTYLAKFYGRFDEPEVNNILNNTINNLFNKPEKFVDLFNKRNAVINNIINEKDINNTLPDHIKNISLNEKYTADDIKSIIDKIKGSTPPDQMMDDIKNNVMNSLSDESFKDFFDVIKKKDMIDKISSQFDESLKDTITELITTSPESDQIDDNSDDQTNNKSNSGIDDKSNDQTDDQTDKSDN